MFIRNPFAWLPVLILFTKLNIISSRWPVWNVSTKSLNAAVIFNWLMHKWEKKKYSIYVICKSCNLESHKTSYLIRPVFAYYFLYLRLIKNLVWIIRIPYYVCSFIIDTIYNRYIVHSKTSIKNVFLSSYCYMHTKPSILLFSPIFLPSCLLIHL